MCIRDSNNDVYIRGLIEISNVCRNNCYYCGIRRSSGSCQRYTLTDEQILECCRQGHDLGFRTFVLQGGEGAVSIERILGLVRTIKSEFPDCAVTLSLGEYEKEDYRRMYAAGADRYLLRHETADEEHYKLLHPAEMSFSRRMQCLRDLKSIGFQTGCGFMVGSPYQKARHIAEDLKFIEEFRPDMCGIGPFIPQKDTPFKDMPAGRVDLTVYLLSLIRLIQPNILLPATTAPVSYTHLDVYKRQGYIPAENIFTAAAIGIISGLAATGANQIGKQLKKTSASAEGQAAQTEGDPKRRPGRLN